MWTGRRPTGCAWLKVQSQPVTRSTDEATRVSVLELADVESGMDGMLVRAVFHNAHGKATSDSSTLTVRP